MDERNTYGTSRDPRNPRDERVVVETVTPVREHRRAPKWPWLLLLLIPIAWFALRDDDRTEEQRAGDVVTDTSAYVAPAGTATTPAPATTTP